MSPLARVNDVDLYYEDHGSGTPVVLLHGGMLSISTAFGPVLPVLARRHRVVAVEFQGHGHTPDTDRPMTIGHLAADVGALADHLGIGAAAFVGYSLGGIVSLEVADTRPALVRRLVLIATPLSRDDLGMTQDLAPDRLPSEADAHAWRAAYRREAPDPDHYDALGERTAAMVAAMASWPPERLATLGVPALVVVGDRDFIGVPTAARAVAHMAGAHLCVLPDTTHVGMLGKADLLLSVIVPFLDEER